jgi:hypothetical protein
MSVQLTEAGTEARSIMRWAWQDPQQRAEAALETIHEMAAAAMPAELPEIQDAGTMLSRLVGTLSIDNAISGPNLSAQLSGPVTIGEQLDLAAIHGHHIPGTQYTFRHGWIPLIGSQLVDKYPGWMVHTRAEKKVLAKAALQDKIESSAHPGLERRRYATVPSAQGRQLNENQLKAVRRHAEAVARAQRARERAASPATPRGPGGTPTTKQESTKDTLHGYDVHRPVTPGTAINIPQGMAMSPEGGLVERAQAATTSLAPGSGTTALPGGGLAYHALAAVANSPAQQKAVAAGQAVKTAPGSAGEALQKTDPALMSLAAPGASQAALKAYIDARVAAEVAAAMGQISSREADGLKSNLAAMHRSQQRLISHIRKAVQASDNQSDRQDRAHLTMYTLFTFAGVGLAIAGIATGIAPIGAAVMAGIVPLAQTIHDYVRSE